MWLLIAFITPIFHGAANILDNYLIKNFFYKKTALIFYSTFLNTIFLPFLFLIFGLPKIPDIQTFGLFFIIGAIHIGYLYPYYKSLQLNDTSIVTALFSLNKFFVPVLAFIVVKEQLTVVQYAGILIVILSNFALNIKNFHSFQLNKSFWWMLICAFILSIETVLYKFIFLSVDWITGFSWPIILSFSLLLTLIPAFRKDIIISKNVFIRLSPIFIIEELFTFIGVGAATYAISVAPVSLVKTIGQTQVIFVLLYAWVFKNVLPEFFNEDINYNTLRKKLIVFAAIIIGVLLSLNP